MAYVTTSDEIRLYVEERGSGPPILFIHEFAGDHRSWEPQVEQFSERYRCIVYGARGYPPSDVPSEEEAYSQAIAVDDALAVLDGLGIERAHIAGLSMGAFCALHLGLRAPERALSLVVAGCGYGAAPEAQAKFRGECTAIAEALSTRGAAAFAPTYAVGPARVQLQNRNLPAWELFTRRLGEHSSQGAALTMLGVQRRRPSLYDLRDELAALEVPTLILAGDEDEGCLEPSLMLKRTIPAAGLAVLPRTGHTSNLEDPASFNHAVGAFLAAVEQGAWAPRDPRSLSGSITGIERSQS